MIAVKVLDRVGHHPKDSKEKPFIQAERGLEGLCKSLEISKRVLIPPRVVN